MSLPWFPVLTLASRLAVETGSPDALCPDVASAEEAIYARLGELHAEDARHWRVRYTMAHAPDASSGDFVRLQIFDPKNRLRLSRDLPLAEESCSTMAQAIALVVDRYFRQLVHDEEMGPVSTPDREEPQRDEVTEPADREPKPHTDALVLSAHAGVSTEPVSPTLGLSLSREIASFSLRSMLTWVVLPLTEELERGGRAELRTALVRVIPSLELSLGRTRLGLGPTVALAGEWGSTTAVPESSVGYRTTAAVGGAAVLRFSVGTGSALELSIVVEAPARPFGGEFVVENDEVLVPPGLRGFASLGFGPAWFW